jgi:hypothetical protein
MGKLLFPLTIFFLTMGIHFALEAEEFPFFVKSPSLRHHAKIKVETCIDRSCSGKGIIQLFKKNDKSWMQEFQSDDLVFELDKDSNPSEVMDLYDEQSPIVFGDFNFDGTEDLAIRNGSNGGYGSASYDVYVGLNKSGNFIKSKELTELASTYLGMFDWDPKEKTILVRNKSGCCWHQIIKFEVIPKKGLSKIYEAEFDGTINQDYIYITEKKKVNGKWKRTVTKEKQDEPSR